MKNKIRKEFISKRKKLNEKEVIELSRLIGEEFFTNFITLAKPIGGYYPINNEANPLALLYKHKKPYLPVITKDKNLDFYPFKLKDKLIKNSFGIGEPKKRLIAKKVPDVLLIPLTVFNRQGYRIGYGGGYYDRYLSQNPNVMKIGIGYSFQETSAQFQEDHDIKLDFIVTEKEVITC